ncbi:DUF4982 domain-containing protein [Pelagicoccus sp. NFK12]|uniref:DUF4982 domain-containing protein n=1 Tax=Pelagicoccus enzymogenes TaxID=2773457 RepID=A0A927F6Y5_9BACT|nr:glycoside hydrolase family 2 TIM barrel-domain containing protein [Pelagicoccus enzymogenes]MBD5779110.1 DUF4982 domain-containing protein [Pelagicoccus enzymogenes]
MLDFPKLTPLQSLKRFAASALAASGLSLSASAHETWELDGNWQFRHEDSGQEWQSVQLPHDWSISLPRSAEKASAGGGGFFETGRGQYRYEFEAPLRWLEQKVFLDFEGIYRNATVSINGVEKVTIPNGYTPFTVDITAETHLGTRNLIEISVDNSAQPNSRWYTGSGIFRPAALRVVDPIHVDPRDIAISTWFLSEDKSLGTVALSAAARNESKKAAEITIDLSIIDPDGLPVATYAESGLAAPGETVTITPKLAVPHPRPWHPDTPELYRLVTRSFVGGRLTDRQETTFGIRSLRFRANEGFLLNGEPIELFGGNVHHDTGILGGAAFREAEFRKARLLKEAGFNAVRTAHNPPSSAFLDACDQYGLIVVAEAFDGWKAKKLKHDYNEIFDENWASDLEAMIRRDRHHPSIVMWSIGNEVYERGKASGIQIAADMAKRIKELDTFRPVTAGINGLGKKEDWPKLDELFSHLDVVGYNYEIDRHAADHQRLPKRIIYSSESYLDDAFKTWKIATENIYVIGDFVWSAIDYLGEAGIGRIFPPDEEARAHWEGSHYPWHGAACGDIDLIGWRKPVSHYRNIVWDRGEMLYAAVLEPNPEGSSWNKHNWATAPMLPSWTWPDTKRGAPLTVEVYSRYPSVRLLLNGKQVGEEKTGEAQAFKAVFEVPYKKGELVAVGLENGVEQERFTIKTAGYVSKIQLQEESPAGDGKGRDLRFVQVQLVDSKGVPNPSDPRELSFSVEGPARILAAGTGQLDHERPYDASPLTTYQGRALVVIEVTGEGDATLTVNAAKTKAGVLKLK